MMVVKFTVIKNGNPVHLLRRVDTTSGHKALTSAKDAAARDYPKAKFILRSLENNGWEKQL